MHQNHPYADYAISRLPALSWHFCAWSKKAKVNDDYLVFSENGEVIKVKARSLKP